MTDRPFSRPVHSKEMPGYEVGGVCQPCDNGYIYVYICSGFQQLPSSNDMLSKWFISLLKAISVTFCGVLDIQGTVDVYLDFKGMKLRLIFLFSQVLLRVSPRTQGSIPEFRVLYGLIYMWVLMVKIVCKFL